MLTSLELDPTISPEGELEMLRQELAQLNIRPTPSAEELERERWKLVIDTSNDAFITTDLAGSLQEWNAMAERLFGWTRAEVLGKNLASTIFPVDRQRRDLAGLQRLLGAVGEGNRLETFATHRDGELIPVEVSIAPMRHEGSFVFNAFIHDITRRRELQLKLTHAQKLESIGQLSAGIAHEINTPTQYVGDNTRFLQESLVDLMEVLAAYGALAEAVRNGHNTLRPLAELDRVIKEVDLDYLTTEMDTAVSQTLEGLSRVTKIVRAMKEFSHPGASSKTAVDLNRAIANTVVVATNEWKYVADVVTVFDPKLPLVPCLPGDFNQVLLNLIVNSAHAISDVVQEGEKGTITISTRLVERWAEIEVADTGTGIPPEIVGRIFDPFFTTKDVGVGSGQGLAIARSVIVDKHGGTIDVASQVGRGTQFVIRLPLDVHSAT